MHRQNLVLTTLLLVVLLLSSLPALPARALEPVPVPAQNVFRDRAGGLLADNGRVRAELTAGGLTFTSIVSSTARLNYRLQEARRGDQVLFTGDDTLPTRQERADHAAYARAGGVQEVYWMLDVAVEQLFVLPRPVEGSGDLVLTGLVSTTLTPVEQGEVAQAVWTLPDGGSLTYGDAVAVDAAGNTSPLRIIVTGAQLQLVVSGSWLDAARFPVVVDPFFTSENTVATGEAAQRTPAVVAAWGGYPLGPFYAAAWSEQVGFYLRVKGATLDLNGAFGASFDPPPQDGDTNQTNPAIAHGININDYYLVWQSSAGNGNIYGVRYYNWGEVEDPALDDLAIGTSAQSSPVVATGTSPEVRYVVAWVSNENASINNIYARYVRASDGYLGTTTYRVNANNTAAQTQPAIAWDQKRLDKMLVAWVEGGNIKAKGINTDGMGIGSALSLSSSGTAQSPSLAFNDFTDEFLVTWSDGGNLYGRRVYWDGAAYARGDGVITIYQWVINQCQAVHPRVAYAFYSPIAGWDPGTNEYWVTFQCGRAVQVLQLDGYGSPTINLWTVAGSPTTGYERRNPAISFEASASIRRFIVVWEGDVLASDGGTQPNIYSRTFDNTRKVVGDESYAYLSPDIAYNPARNKYLAAWVRKDSTDHYTLWAKTITVDGTPAAIETAICNSTTSLSCGATNPNDTGIRNGVQVAYDSANDRFLITWADYRTGSSGDIYAREIKGDGTLISGDNPFAIVSQTGEQANPRLTFDADAGKYYLVWQDGRGATKEIYGGQVVPDTVAPFTAPTLDPVGGRLISGGTTGDDTVPDVATSAYAGDSNYRYLVLWINNGNVWRQFVKEDGTLLDSNNTLPGPTGQTVWSVAVENGGTGYAGSQYFVSCLASSWVWGTLVSSQGTPGTWSVISGLTDYYTMAPGLAVSASRSGGYYFVTSWWEYGGQRMVDLRAVYDFTADVDPLPGPAFGLPFQGSGAALPALACGGNQRCLVAYQNSDDDIYVGMTLVEIP